MAEDRHHVALVHTELHNEGLGSGLQDQIQRCLQWIGSAIRGNVGDGPSCQVGLAGMEREQGVIPIRINGQVLPFTFRVRPDGSGDLRPLPWVLESQEQRFCAVSVKQRRHDCVQIRGSGGVGVLIPTQIEPIGTGGIQSSQQPLGLSPLVATGQLQVRNLYRYPRGPPYLYRLLQGSIQKPPLVADVGRI